MKALLWVLKLLVGFIVITELATVSFLWFAPPRTSYMLRDGEPIAYQ
ncbi:hypothetical protein QFZ60_001576 [Arthrobacter sp. B2I5]|nr:hypothetical protein [Arthrobacter sp. B2I5]MDQ0825403.1 hypothetical protein [Arthrobacter sp. B2I5]